MDWLVLAGKVNGGEAQITSLKADTIDTAPNIDQTAVEISQLHFFFTLISIHVDTGLLLSYPDKTTIKKNKKYKFCFVNLTDEKPDD